MDKDTDKKLDNSEDTPVGETPAEKKPTETTAPAAATETSAENAAPAAEGKKPSSGKRTGLIVAAVVLIAIAAVGAIIWATNKKPEQEDIAAIVNGVPISMDAFNTELAAMEESSEQYSESEKEERMEELKQVTIDSMVDAELARQLATEAGITVSEDEIQEQYDYVIQSVGTEEDLAKMLEDQGTTEAEFRQQISDWLLTQNYIEQEIGEPEVTEAEVQEDYNANQDSYTDEDGNVMPFEEIKDQIYDMLVADKQNELFNQKVDEFRDKSTIAIFVVDENASKSSDDSATDDSAADTEGDANIEYDDAVVGN